MTAVIIAYIIVGILVFILIMKSVEEYCMGTIIAKQQSKYYTNQCFIIQLTNTQEIKEVSVSKETYESYKIGDKFAVKT